MSGKEQNHVNKSVDTLRPLTIVRSPNNKYEGGPGGRGAGTGAGGRTSTVVVLVVVVVVLVALEVVFLAPVAVVACP